MKELPGEEFVRRGLDDLANDRQTAEALLVSIGASRLRRAGLAVLRPIPEADHLLYLMLARAYGDDAHARYNALLRRLVSFERALECAS
ncbi:MAG: hypothetical protein HYY16_05480 [Planctomycetes bacterium]|nr:hypothetical protein [Planctomycetota bacterium]